MNSRLQCDESVRPIELRRRAPATVTPAVARIWGRVSTRLLHAAWLGYALGALDALLIRGDLSNWRRVRLVCGAAAVGAIVAIVIALIRAVVVEGIALVRGIIYLPRPRAERASSARVWSAFFAGSIAYAGFGGILLSSERISVSSLRQTLLALAAAVAIGVAVIGAQRLEPILGCYLPKRSDATSGRTHPTVKYFLLVVVPVLTVSAGMLVTYGEQLGVLRRALLVGMFLVLETWTFRVAWRFRRGALRQILGWQTPLFAIFLGALLLKPGSAAVQAASRGKVLPDGLDVVYRVTDFDRDGFSGLFGGRDCASFNAKRNPGAVEIPGNGFDENCDGEDGIFVSLRSQLEPRFLGRTVRPDEPFHIIWYVVDSLRADHLSAYGYHLDTSPTLKALASESWVFEQAYSQSSTTALSVPSMFSGRNPGGIHFKRNGFPIASADEFYLARELTSRGYVTRLLINDWVRVQLPGIQYGFSQVIAYPPEVKWRSGDRVLESLTTLLDEVGLDGQRLFAVAHIDDVHHPYTAASGTAVPEFASPGEQAAYDRGIALFDRALAAFIDELKLRALWDQTVLIITADHGEEFGEHGGAIHSRTCYEEATHVPLLVRIPGEAAQRIKSRVALVDIAPTLLELVGAEDASARLDGQSLFMSVHASDKLDPNRPIHCTIYDVMPGRSNYFNRTIRAGKWSLHEELITGRRELYDLDVDRAERKNLTTAGKYGTVQVELSRVLANTLEGNLFRVSQGLE